MINKFYGKYKWLSNFEPCSVMFQGEFFPTTEHAYQAVKHAVGSELFCKIRDAKTPHEAMLLGRSVPPRQGWDEDKLDKMYNFNRQKFFIHVPLKLKLLATADQHLEEANKHGDVFWGTVDGVGENHLGKILMRIRKELQEEILEL